jgi:hypothetical protein
MQAEEEWVTDRRIIKVIYELRGFLPGDEVKIINAKRSAVGPGDEFDGQVGIVQSDRSMTGYDWVNWFPVKPAVGVAVSSKRGSPYKLWLLEESVGAWRRPEKTS